MYWLPSPEYGVLFARYHAISPLPAAETNALSPRQTVSPMPLVGGCGDGKRVNEIVSVSVQVFFSLVTGAHVQEDGTDCFALGLLHGAVLDESTEGGETRTKTSHDERCGVFDWELHDGGLDAGGYFGTDGELAQVSGCLSETITAFGVRPCLATASSEARMVHDAPSVICEELPAVT